MHSREQYLARVRKEYSKASKRGKTRLLNEARKRTKLNRKVLIGKLAHPPKPEPGKRGPRKATYGADVVRALVKLWEIFDYPCGQRLAPAVREQLEKLRRPNEVQCTAARRSPPNCYTFRPKPWTGCWRVKSKCVDCARSGIRQRIHCCTGRSLSRLPLSGTPVRWATYRSTTCSRGLHGRRLP